MSEVKFNFHFRQASSFMFEDLNIEDGLEKEGKTLKIIFPDKSYLKLSEHDTVFPVPFVMDSIPGEDNNHILEDLDEWGYSQSNAVMMDIATLKQDLEIYPDMYKDKLGNTKAFNYLSFPDGLYEIEFSYKNNTPTRNTGNPGLEIAPIKDSDYVLNTFNTKEEVLALSHKYREMLPHKDTPTSQEEMDRFRDTIMKVHTLLWSAEYSLIKYAIEDCRVFMEAAVKVSQMKTLHNRW